MPKSRRPKESSSDSDSGPDDPTPAKKSKSSGGAAKAKGNPAVEGDEPTWDLGKMKKVKVRQFKGTTYIDIREWYVDKNTMDTKPGKKGISLNCEQYQKLKSILDEIDEHLP